MNILIVFLATLDVVVAAILIGLILIQQSKGAGLGTSFGGAAESVFGGQAVNHLSKATVWLTSTFFVVTLLLAILIGHSEKDQSILETIEQPEVKKEVVEEEVKDKVEAVEAVKAVKADAKVVETKVTEKAVTDVKEETKTK